MTDEEKYDFIQKVTEYLDESCEEVINTLGSNIEARMDNFPQFYSGIPENIRNACYLVAKESYLASTKSFEEALKHALSD